MSCESQLERYRVLVDTARCFGKTMDLETLIDQILNRSQAVMRAEACSLFLPDAESNELVLHSTDAKIAALAQRPRLPAGKGIAGAVFQTRQPINIKNAQEDARHFGGISKQVGIVTRAMLTIPLLDGSHCVGVMQVLNPLDREVFDERDEEIFEGFGGLIANALVRLEAERREIELAKSKQELQVAREIQESFLPAARQDFECCEVMMNYFPASAVGGDFCCVHRLEDKRLLLALGDVTGKGIPAALTMARTTAIIKATLGGLRADLGAWVSGLNDQLVSDLQAGRFVGLTFLLADAGDETLQICAAGQFAPLHFNRCTWGNYQVSNHLPLGIASGVEYRASKAPLKPGEAWLLYSDGIPEARNRAGEDFTTQRFQAALEGSTRPTNALRNGVQAWKKFAASAPQHDDASLLLLQWRGARPTDRLEITCCPETMALEREFVECWAAYAGFDDVTAGQLVLACDEAVTNVFRHAYGRKPGPICCAARLTPTDLVIEITDHGPPIDPSRFEARDPEELRPGGLGTVIMSKVFDEVSYAPLEGGTLLTLRKSLAS